MGTQERRRFFRINDSLKLSYRELSDEELEQQVEGDTPQNPLASLYTCDPRIAEIIEHINNTAPELSELAGLLNKKIDSVINLLAVESGIIHDVAYHMHEVNVSACGIGFQSDEPFAVGAVMSIDMILTPTDQHIVAVGKVVSCEAESNTESNAHYVRVDFENISSVDQEMLIQHLVKRQLVLHREQKANAQQGEADAEK